MIGSNKQSILTDEDPVNLGNQKKQTNQDVLKLKEIAK
jgi:hypothetical protein